MRRDRTETRWPIRDALRLFPPRWRDSWGFRRCRDGAGKWLVVHRVSAQRPAEMSQPSVPSWSSVKPGTALAKVAAFSPRCAQNVAEMELCQWCFGARPKQKTTLGSFKSVLVPVSPKTYPLVNDLPVIDGVSKTLRIIQPFKNQFR